MNAKRITRRQALAVGVGAVVAGRAAAAPVPKDGADKSWVGKIVLPMKHDVLGSPRVPGEPAPLSKPTDSVLEGYVLMEASYGVKSEKGDSVEILLSGGTACWVEKKQLVPLTDAVEHFNAALKLNPKDTFALNSRGWAYYLLGQIDKAVADFDSFLRLTPSDGELPADAPRRWEGLVNRGLVLAESGEFKKAIADLDEAAKLFPAFSIARVNRGYTYELMGEYDLAIEDYRSARHLLGENNLAWLRATCPDPKFRDAEGAVKIAKVVCEKTADREGMYLDTLAAAYASAGKFADAVKAQEKALEDKSFAVRYGEEAQKRLKLYKDRKPYRTEPVGKK
jgi:tetratricopeptide (TPR) repeat protein